MGRKKSWTEKLEDSRNLPRVEKITEKMRRKWGPGTVVIPAPKEVDELMKKCLLGRSNYKRDPLGTRKKTWRDDCVPHMYRHFSKNSSKCC